MNADQLLNYLSLKKWRLERTITDHLNDRTSKYSAWAELCRTESRFIYEEIGELQHDNQIFEMKRRYLYRKSGAQRIQVSFEDDRPFYQINCDELPNLAFKHFCDPDGYSGKMTVNPQEWLMTWTIVGPKKDLVIESQYR